MHNNINIAAQCDIEKAIILENIYSWVNNQNPLNNLPPIMLPLLRGA